jgi:hypothetical protein
LPRISVTGDQLPTARYISSTIHRDLGFHDHAVTVFLPAFGQLIDHDMASGAETKGLLSLSIITLVGTKIPTTSVTNDLYLFIGFASTTS